MSDPKELIATYSINEELFKDVSEIKSITSRIEKLEENFPLSQELFVALQLIMDSVDYTDGNCAPNEMIAAILPVEIIRRARNALNKFITS